MTETSLPTVAVAGGTGTVGRHITLALLSPQFRHQYKTVKVLTRRKFPETVELEQAGASIVLYCSSTIRSAISDVDVLINAISYSGSRFQDEMVYAMKESTVKLYFIVDYMWPYIRNLRQKTDHVSQVGLLCPGIRSCELLVSLCLETDLNTELGFDLSSSEITIVGSADDAVISPTSLSDIGKSVANIAYLPQNEVPLWFQIAGDIKSIAQIASIFNQARVGEKEIVVREISRDTFMQDMRKRIEQTPKMYLRCYIATGKLNWGEDGDVNTNDFVNPGGKEWKWKTVEDLAREMGQKRGVRKPAGDEVKDWEWEWVGRTSGCTPGGRKQ